MSSIRFNYPHRRWQLGVLSIEILVTQVKTIGYAPSPISSQRNYHPELLAFHFDVLAV